MNACCLIGLFALAHSSSLFPQIVPQEPVNGVHTFAADDVTHGNKAFYILVWARIIVFRELLGRNYSIIMSDLDTVWLKNAHRCGEQRPGF